MTKKRNAAQVGVDEAGLKEASLDTAALDSADMDATWAEDADGSDLGFYRSERQTLQRKVRARIRKVADPDATAAALYESIADIPAELADLGTLDGVTALTRNKLFLKKRQISNPYFRRCTPGPNGTVAIDGRSYIHYSGYDYLGLCQDERVRSAAKAAIDLYGTTVSASRIASGDIPLHRELEAEIADFLRVEDSVVFISGYGTNVSVIDHLFGPGDLLICDEQAHNSLIAGCERSGARFMRFAHNDPDSLERMLQRHRRAYQRVLILLEGVYSMEGSLPDLARFVAIKKAYKAMIMVDEAHSFGTLGAGGRGISEHCGVAASEIDIWMGTLSKSFASVGGFIAGRHEIVDYIRYTTAGFIFSVGLAPGDAAAALESIRVTRREPWRIEALAAKAERLRAGFQQHGLNTATSARSPIVPLIQGDSIVSLKLSERLFADGINVQPILFPGVPESQTRLRFFVSAAHRDDDIDRTVALVADAVRSLR